MWIFIAIERKTIISLFAEYLVPRKNFTVERHKFFTRLQSADESISEYVVDLKNKSISSELIHFVKVWKKMSWYFVCLINGNTSNSICFEKMSYLSLRLWGSVHRWRYLNNVLNKLIQVSWQFKQQKMIQPYVIQRNILSLVDQFKDFQIKKESCHIYVIKIIHVIILIIIVIYCTRCQQKHIEMSSICCTM